MNEVRAICALSLRVVAFCVRHKFHVAVCAIAALWAWSGLLQADLRFRDVLVVSMTVLTVYQWNRLTDVCEDQLNCREEFEYAIRYSREIKVFCVLAIVSVGFILLTLESKAKSSIVGMCLILGYLYGRTPDRNGLQRLKNVPIMKNLSSGLGWALLTVLYPAVAKWQTVDIRVWFAFGYMFAAVVMVEMIWDIRDLNGDREAGVRSVPVTLGIRMTKSLIQGLNSLTALVLVAVLWTGRLSGAWGGILVNFGLMQIAVVVVTHYTAFRRPLSHLLVLVQSVLLLGLGAVAR